MKLSPFWMLSGRIEVIRAVTYLMGSVLTEYTYADENDRYAIVSTMRPTRTMA